MTVTAFALWGGCAAPALVGPGEACVSLSECQLGLTCIKGKCSDDLSSLEGEVPEYEDAAVVMDAGSAAGEDGGEGADAGMPGSDASTPRPDASTPKMDASTPQPDASAPRDASVPDAGHFDTGVVDASVDPDADGVDAE